MKILQESMRHAIKLSYDKMQQDCGGPFGAVIVKGDKIVAEGWNQVTSTNDPTAHAEVVAIRNACATLETFSLEGCVLVTSCEPCPMCLSAAYWARVDKIIYANTKKDAADIGFDDDFIYAELNKAYNERSIPMIQMLRDEALASFKAWHERAVKTPY